MNMFEDMTLGLGLDALATISSCNTNVISLWFWRGCSDARFRNCSISDSFADMVLV